MDLTRETFELQSSRFFPYLFVRQPLEICRLSTSAIAFARFLSQQVGDPSRLAWSERAWRRSLSAADTFFFAVYAEGEPVGAFELRADGDDVVLEIFGVLPNYRNEDIERTMLTMAVERAFSMGARRVIRNGDGLLPASTFCEQGFVKRKQ